MNLPQSLQPNASFSFAEPSVVESTLHAQDLRTQSLVVSYKGTCSLQQWIVKGMLNIQVDKVLHYASLSAMGRFQLKCSRYDWKP